MIMRLAAAAALAVGLLGSGVPATAQENCPFSLCNCLSATQSAVLTQVQFVGGQKCLCITYKRPSGEEYYVCTI